MDIYLDFEATQFKENIIAIGATCAYGDFDCLVHPPKGDKITKFITKLTGITSEMAENALSIDKAFSELYSWIEEMINYCQTPVFYHVYGNMDKIFLKNTAHFITIKYVKKFVEKLADSLIDDSIEVCKFFHTKTIGVYRALRYFNPQAPKQDHDPLNDAIALKYVMNFISMSPPFEEKIIINKEKENIPENCCIIATHIHDSKAKPKYFKFVQDAEDWVIQKILSKNKQASIDTIKKNFRKALKNNSNYTNWNWKKIK